MTHSLAYLRRLHSPIGRIELTGDGECITSLCIERAGILPHDDLPEMPNTVLETAVEQLTEYFDGHRREFDVPMRIRGTEFQRSVWSRLRALRWGERTSYGELGVEIGRPRSYRAIGGAVGANPVPILVGCHRVLSSDGRITGYSGGNGVSTKLWLLEHEGIVLAA